ncbi:MULTISPECIES: DNA-directed RNA polymerase subunit P [Methanosphaera]|uniref:DNA-directed RNA polymerase subunit Rpo12 n=1 Tax=Methanosphaera stadtmanae TaxID=2317 RepID=A0A328Q0Z6_9EURY|nr:MULTISPECIES: DNA-directed RNA polymerase subunit P [Methanosphaera]MDO5821856.1 DNA-directed RNA polymerase subunit P [Methanosphaera sp.]MEE0489585.1 DNA-directed RNA polymerase subunit P [Methanosphaera stadtmanae]OEC92853.1 DNA-directed RNA polymerase subunit P [Methanosphaera sp. A6]RAP02674.1 DNA-directed RNA polymerase subunit P [Methanosphaera stadtmanae]RAP46505.1 MAG: DNA-directed RNA polymerase subunit P [Methanosphaera sp. DEW79]
MYKCIHCGKEVDIKTYAESKCPYCRYRILFKEVPVVKRTVKAR